MKKIIFISLFLLSACQQMPDETRLDGRWYTASQLQLGEKIYRANCIVCHKENATGTKQWKKTLADGNYPPPPLNGSAHAWHHPLSTLSRSIKNGGIPLGGTMPAFKDKLSDKEVLAVIAYLQSLWSDRIYQDWKNRDGVDMF